MGHRSENFGFGFGLISALLNFILSLEAATGGVLKKKVFLKISQNSHPGNCFSILFYFWYGKCFIKNVSTFFGCFYKNVSTFFGFSNWNWLFYVELVLTVKRCSMNQDLHQEKIFKY